MINPYTGLIEDSEEKEDKNSYSRFRDPEADFPDVEYLDLDNVPEDAPLDVVIEKVSDIDMRKRASRRVWQDTNKQEWWNIYEHYMKQRARDLNGLTRTYRRPSKCNFKRTKEPLKREYPEYVAESQDEQNEEDLNTFVLLEDMSDQDGQTVDTESTSGQNTNSIDSDILTREEYEEVEYLTRDVEDGEEAAASNAAANEGGREAEPAAEEDDEDEYGEVEYLTEDESFVMPTTAPPKRPPRATPIKIPLKPSRDVDRTSDHFKTTITDDKMQRALDAVRTGRLSRQQAAEQYRVSLAGLCSRLQHNAPPRAKSKSATLSREKFQKMLDNTIVMLGKSNMCIFRYRKKGFACFFCNTSFEDMGLLRRHTSKNHTFLKMKRKLLKQRFTYHRVDISDLKCRICSQSIFSLEDFQRHLPKHDIKLPRHGSTLMPFKIAGGEVSCQFCFREFGTLTMLFKHMSRHYLHCICDICCMAFPNSQALKLHQYHIHHPIECEPCGVMLKNVHAKRRHDANVHGVKISHSKTRFKCSFCPQTFLYDYMRIKHILEEHNGDRTLYKCDYCPKMFITNHWCTRHMNCVHRIEQEALKFKGA